ncbi:MAG: hypothetical protein EXS15_01470 [Phycisphaerales bacterium]|nr:hypothetical protein [Phycisphaerales bacterium]
MAALIAVVGWILSQCVPPSWINAQKLRDDPESVARARDLEQNLAAAIARVRPKDEPWAIRIRDLDINAWVATRLPQWIDHDPTLAWPVDGAQAQVHFGAGTATISIAAQDRIYSGSFTTTVTQRGIIVLPGWGAIGRLPIPGGASMVTRWLKGAAAESLELPKSFRLGDGREVEILHVEFVAGALEIEFLTR